MLNIGILKLKLQMPANGNLKDKRRIIQSLLARIKSKFNVTVAEIDHQDQWQLATLACVTISSDSRHAEVMTSTILDFVQNDLHGDFILIDHSQEMISGA
jgi:uncharacterized protein